MGKLKKYVRNHLKNYLRTKAGKWDLVDPMVWIRHRPWHHLPAAGAFVAQGLVALDDGAIERLLSAYQKSHNPGHYGNDSMWRGFFEQRQASLHEVFMKGSVTQARAILANPGQNDLFYGFDNLYADCLQRCKQNPGPRLAAYARFCLDDLLQCAVAWGVLGCEHPESRQWRNSTLTADEVIARMEKFLRIRITFPNPYPDEFGLVTSRGIASDRVNDAMDMALKIKNLVKDVAAPKVLEIGGGLGRVAYYAIQFGLPQYEIVDLPFTAISQGYFLMSTLGANKVVLAGEKAIPGESIIKLSSPSEFLASEEQYDLVLNADSLTEIDREVASKYWEKIEAKAARFLSINHEINPFTVQELYAKSRRVKRVLRHPNWLRRGYVDELVEFV